jgi:hypothetical protein
MRLFLDCEFTQLSAGTKLISLALVGQDRREFYVELQDTWQVDDCSEFVKKSVLPQLWGGEYAMPLTEATSALLRFLATYDEELEVVTDAPVYGCFAGSPITMGNGLRMSETFPLMPRP